MVHRFSLKLNSPHGVFADRNTVNGAPVLIGDTLSHRLVSVPTEPYRYFRIRFWVIVSGPEREKL